MDTDTATVTRIHWELIVPYDQDAQFLKVVRYEFGVPNDEDQDYGLLASWYLTRDGWLPFEGYQVFDAEAMPHVAGCEIDNSANDWWHAPLLVALASEGFDIEHPPARHGKVERTINGS